MSTPAYTHNDAPCARAAFYAIACDPRRHVAVQACAGAGKTWMLVSRMLRALLDGAEPQDILAITFTRKAAGEMRQRLQQWLAEFARATPERRAEALIERGIDLSATPDAPQQLQNLYQKLIDHGRPVQIRTFHSWFAALLGAAPLQVLDDLGLPSAFELLEDTSDAVAELWRRYLRRVARDDGLRADYAALVAQLGRTRAHQALEVALDKRAEFVLADAAGRIDEAVPPAGALDAEFAPFDQPCDALLSAAAARRWQARASALGAEKNKTPQKTAAAIIDALALPGGAERLAVLRKAFFVADEDRLSKNLAKFPAAQEAESELQRLLVAERQHQARLHHQRMTRLARTMVAEFAQLKRERGWIDMGDVERAACALLSDPFLGGWVQQRLDLRVRHLLVDEFQDTSPLQWQTLHAWLSGYAGAGGGPQAPSVFIVGDPKQSIYRFRRADPRVFDAAQTFIAEALGGDRLACDHTHRNAPALLDAINTVMLRAQAEGEFDDYRAHTTEVDAGGQLAALPLIPRPQRDDGDGDGDGERAAPAGWRDSLTTPRTVLEESLRTLECRQAAHWIAAQIAAGVPAQEIMVLSRKRGPLGLLQTELRRLGIACEQPEPQSLGRLPVVQDVLALVDALVSPGHDLSLARALKSPLFGLDDQALTRIALTAQAARAAGQTHFTWLDALQESELLGHVGRDLHADLMQYRAWLTTLPPHDALQAIYQHRDVLARFAAAAPAPDRAHQLALLRALLPAALQVQGGRCLTAYQWLRALRRQHLPAPRRATTGAVQLLTVHGAKGLQADTVLLLNSAAGEGASRGGPGVLIDWPETAETPCRVAFLASDSAPPPSLQELAQQEARAEAREELNVLYVAMTRACRQLVISGVTPHRLPPASVWQRLAPLAAPLPAPVAAPAPVPGMAGAPAAVSMLVVPPAPAQTAEAAIQEIAPEETAEPGGEAARLGEAMHWLLQHAADTPAGWRADRLAQAMRRFAINAAEAAHAEQLARVIHGGEAAWAWDASEVLEAFDEVELVHQGQRLRIDRLVRRRAGPHGEEAWWVLDYKSAARPEQDPRYQAQLRRYHEAVRRLHAPLPVHAAFLSARGRLLIL